MEDFITMRSFINNVKTNMLRTTVKVRIMLSDKRGESAVGTAITILTSVVIGALLLGGLYLLFKDTVLPTLTQKIQDMFNYKG